MTITQSLHQPSQQQTGVALLTALVVVAVASTAASHLVTEQQLDIRRTGNLVYADQALIYALATESFARVALRHDARTNNVDGPTDIWAQDNPPLPVPGGYVSGQIDDLQGRFNLNNLIVETAAQEGTTERRWAQDSAAIGRYEALLNHLEIDPQHVQALTDWLDPDQVAQPDGGAEDSYYLGLERPYRTADQRLASPSELRLIRGVSAQAYETLYPHITALPEHTAINVNMASEAVLASLGLDASAIATVLERREEQPFSSIADLRSTLNLTEAELPGVDLTVSSRYFLVTAEVQLERGRLTTYSILARAPNGKLEVLRRGLGTR